MPYSKLCAGFVLTVTVILLFGMNSPLPDESVRYPLLFFCALFSIYVLGLRRADSDIFAPYHAISLLHLLYAFAALLFVQKTGTIPYGDIVTQHVLKIFVAAVIFSQFGIVVGNSLSARVRPFVTLNPPVLPSGKSLVLLLTIFLLLVEHDAINLLDIVSYGDRVLDYNVQKRTSSTSGLVDFVHIFCQTALIALLLKILFEFRQTLLRIVAAAFLGMITLKYLMAGNRADLVMAVVAIAVSINYLKWRIRMGVALFFGIAGYIGFSLLSIARVSANPAEMIELVLGFLGDNGIAALSLDKSGELLAGSNLFKLIMEVEHDGLRYGGNLVSSLLAFIPRFLMDRSTFFGNEEFVIQFYPDTYFTGGGHGYFLPMDGYWDFGLIGAGLFSLLYSFCCAHVYRSFIKRRNEPFAVVFYGIFFSQGILFCMRSGVFAAAKQYLIYASGPFSIALVFIFFSIIGTSRNKEARGEYGAEMVPTHS